MPDESMKLEFNPETNPVSKLINELNKKIIGQPRVIKELDYSLQRGFAEIGDSNRPVAVVMFIGPSGVGKTETALAMAEILKPFRMEILKKEKSSAILKEIETLNKERDSVLKSSLDENRKQQVKNSINSFIQAYVTELKDIENIIEKEYPGLIRVDCAKFTDKYSSSSLVSSPPGYIGSEEPGLLDPFKINNNPYAVILFDEFEKAHPEIYNVLLPAFDNGILQMSSPIRIKQPLTKITTKEIDYVDFRKAIVVITANIGSKKMEEAITNRGKMGFQVSTIKETEKLIDELSNNAYLICKEEYEKTFPREFKNRIDRVITFLYLQPQHKRKILDLRLADVQKRINRKNNFFILKYSEEAKLFLLQKADHFLEQMRGLNHTIEKELVTPLSGFINQKDIQKGDVIEIRKGEDKLEFYLTKRFT